MQIPPFLGSTYPRVSRTWSYDSGSALPLVSRSGVTESWYSIFPVILSPMEKITHLFSGALSLIHGTLIGLNWWRKREEMQYFAVETFLHEELIWECTELRNAWIVYHIERNWNILSNYGWKPTLKELSKYALQMYTLFGSWYRTRWYF